MKAALSLFLFFAFTLGYAQQTYTVTNLNDSGPGSLREVMANASSLHDTIEFSPSVLTSGSDTLFLNSRLPVIAGSGKTIRGIMNQTDTLFIQCQQDIFFSWYATGYSRVVRFEDLAIVNTLSEWRSPITMDGISFLELKNCYFEGNGNIGSSIDDWSRGGVIRTNGLDSIVISDCTFINNWVSRQPGETSHGGVMYSHEGIVKIKDCEFESNHSDGFGAALFLEIDGFRMERCAFENNVAYDSVYSRYTNVNLVNQLYYGDAEILSSRFENNIGTAMTAHVVNGIVDVESCYFAGNAGEDYSALSADGDEGVQVKNTTFYNNTSLATYYGWSTANFTSIDKIHLTNCSFLYNHHTTRSAFRIWADTTYMTNCTVMDQNPNGPVPPIDLYTSSTRLFMSGSLYYGAGGNMTTKPYNPTNFISTGFNAFTPPYPPNAEFTDIQIDSTFEHMPLGLYGGTVPVMPAKRREATVDRGDFNDMSPAQNGPVFGIRDMGAAETGVYKYTEKLHCGNYFWRGQNRMGPGTFTDTAYSSTQNSIDSVSILILRDIDNGLVRLGDTLMASESEPGTQYQWVSCDSTGHQLVLGDTLQYFVPAANGYYAVVVENSGCIDTSECVEVAGISVAEHQQANYSIYPNPTSGKVTIQAEVIAGYSLYSLTGRCLAVSGEQAQGHVTLDLGELPAGVYLIHWVDQFENIHIHRVVKH